MQRTPQMAQAFKNIELNISFYNQNQITWANKFPIPGDRIDVSVSHRGHGDDGPVQSGGHRVEHRPLLVLLPDVCEAAEYQHAHDDDQHEQPQLFVTEIRGTLDYSNYYDNAR